MLPNIVIGDREITPYAICALIGILLAGGLAFFSVRKKDKSKDADFVIVMLVAILGVGAGGSLLYAITHIPRIPALISEGHDIISIAMAIFGGSVFYGGLFGGLLAGLIGCKLMKVSPSVYADIAAFMIPFFHIFGRIGCFLSGCCFGMKSDIGFVYHYSPITAANGDTRFPIQLVEAAGNLIIFTVIYLLWRKVVMKTGKLENRLLGIYFVSYPVMRFILEFFRGDTYRGVAFGIISTSQVISIFAFILGIILLTRKHGGKNIDNKSII